MYDLKKLGPKELATLKVLASCSKVMEAAKILSRSPKTLSSHKRHIQDKFGITTIRQWDTLCAQVRGQPMEPLITAVPELWMGYVGACSLLSRLQRLITDGEEGALVEQAINDCAAMSAGRLRVIRVSNGVALEPADVPIDKPYKPMRTLYEDAP